VKKLAFSIEEAPCSGPGFFTFDAKSLRGRRDGDTVTLAT